MRRCGGGRRLRLAASRATLRTAAAPTATGGRSTREAGGAGGVGRETATEEAGFRIGETLGASAGAVRAAAAAAAAGLTGGSGQGVTV